MHTCQRLNLIGSMFKFALQCDTPSNTFHLRSPSLDTNETETNIKKIQ